MVDYNERPYARGYYKDPDPIYPLQKGYDEKQVSPEVKKLVRQMKEKMQGVDTREALARVSEIVDLVSNEARNTANESDDRSKDTQKRFNDQIEGTTNSDEVIDARRPYQKEAYQTLGARLNDSDDEQIKTKSDLINRGVNPIDFGAVGDGNTDDTDSIRQATDYCLKNNMVLVGTGKYRLTDTINLRHVNIDMQAARFMIDHDDIGLILGGHANRGNNPPQSIYSVERVNTSNHSQYVQKSDAVASSIQGNPEVRIVGSKGQEIKIENTHHVQLYADGTETVRDTDGSIAYSNFHLKFVDIIEFNTNTNYTDFYPWINENSFFLKRSKILVMDGLYNHNHNIFYAGTFEQECYLDFKVGSSNKLYNVRFESEDQVIYFSESTYANTIIQSWASNRRSFVNGHTAIVHDYGVSNQVIRDSVQNFKETSLLDLNEGNLRVFRDDYGFQDRQETNFKDINLQVKGLTTFTRSNGRRIFLSELIPVNPGDVVQIASNTGVRVNFMVYNDEKSKLSKAGHPNIDGGGDTQKGYVIRDGSVTQYDDIDGFQNEANSNPLFIIASQEISYVRIELLGPGFDYAMNYLKVILKTSANQYDAGELTVPQIPIRRSIPTVGFAPLGYKISRAWGGWYTCIDSYDGNLESNVTSGRNEIQVKGHTAQVGDVIGIELNSNDAHWTEITGINGEWLTLSDSVPVTVNRTSRVVINRWQTDA